MNDTDGVGEDEVTVTSGLAGLHAQTKRTKIEIEKRGLHPVEAQTKVRRARDRCKEALPHALAKHQRGQGAGVVITLN